MIWIAGHHVAEIRTDLVRHAPNETGGVVVGYIVSSGDYVVSHILLGGPNARRSRYRFVPDYEFHESAVAQLYVESRRRLIYLGDWHTHPSGNCVPSRDDRRTLRRISRYRHARISQPIMIIAGGDGLELRCWGIECRRFGVFRCRNIRDREIVIYN